MKRCQDWENCIAYEVDAKECKKNNGCMTKANIKAYLKWCARAMA